ncbi:MULTISPECIES: helix-turn-helix domain-containing protein [unclassified Haladaptatus]|uniref:helix-turn-helix domain-containing protein n=1 Tax=unclassified Haladaptatus TaxID=2622732 RepID=UPI0023E83B91|nr:MULTISPECIES: helix-turn-helix domain-containing protein [unclassified Haladaptatus]
MLRATLYLDLQCDCVLSKITSEGDEAFTVTQEEVLDDENITFLIEAGERSDRFESRLRADEMVNSVERVGTSGLLVTKQSCGALPIIRKNHGMLQGLDRVNGNERVFDVIVFRREDLKAIVADLREIGTVRLRRLTPVGDTTGSLSPRQEEVVRTALEQGYFDWPRKIDAETLATQLDITHTTLLEHLRKAEKKLLAEALHRSPSQVAVGNPPIAHGRSD